MSRLPRVLAGRCAEHNSRIASGFRWSVMNRSPQDVNTPLSIEPQGLAAPVWIKRGTPDYWRVSVALFLASDDSRYLTGNTLFVDGGSHINGVPWLPQAKKATA